MLRKSLNILTALMILVSTTGIVVHKHFCMGNLVESSFIHQPESCCGENSGCCANESHVYQLDQDYVFFKQIVDFVQYVFDAPEVWSEIFLIHKADPKAKNPVKILRPPDISTLLSILQIRIL